MYIWICFSKTGSLNAIFFQTSAWDMYKYKDKILFFSVTHSHYNADPVSGCIWIMPARDHTPQQGASSPHGFAQTNTWTPVYAPAPETLKKVKEWLGLKIIQHMYHVSEWPNKQLNTADP